jgi:hypothetical protein
LANAVCSGVSPAVSTTARGCDSRARFGQLVRLVPDQAEHVADLVHQSALGAPRLPCSSAER